MEHHKKSKFLKDSIVSKFVTTKWVEVNDLSGVNILPTKLS